ncbi:UNVERIFIED_CONTAM: hypothetical protein Sradi_4568900 [Sesamum radiatum]|uniref:SWIM-type domain-containing protein n=1 Tax=Sesamum radiatum TaxID=300843 RepID=A0AAW2NDR1_SESRA
MIKMYALTSAKKLRGKDKKADIVSQAGQVRISFEVSHYMENHIVYLNERHCSCGMFQLVGYPCCHAIAAINYHRLNVEDYVDSVFKKEKYLAVYNHMINPVPGMHDFEESPLGKVAPPSVKSKVGRPKKIPQASHASQFMPSTQGSHPMTNEMPQTSQFMTSSQGSQSRTNEMPSIFHKLRRPSFTQPTTSRPRFVPPRSSQFTSPLEIPLQPAQISTATQPPSNSNAQMHQSLQPSDRPVQQAPKRKTISPCFQNNKNAENR